MRNKHLRNLAMQLTSQLPDDRDDLYFVLDLMREIADKWLYLGHELGAKDYSLITEAYLARRLELVEGVEDPSFDDSNVIKFAGREEQSPR